MIRGEREKKKSQRRYAYVVCAQYFLRACDRGFPNPSCVLIFPSLSFNYLFFTLTAWSFLWYDRPLLVGVPITKRGMWRLLALRRDILEGKAGGQDNRWGKKVA